MRRFRGAPKTCIETISHQAAACVHERSQPASQPSLLEQSMNQSSMGPVATLTGNGLHSAALTRGYCVRQPLRQDLERLRGIWSRLSPPGAALAAAGGLRSGKTRSPPFIRCTADPAKADKRTRSKYAAMYKSESEPLDQFIQRKGGINACAGRFSRQLGRTASSRTAG
jgi:hypothetical protein